MVLPDRIELSTSPLPMECSTTELRQHATNAGIGPKAPATCAVPCHKATGRASAGAACGVIKNAPRSAQGGRGLLQPHQLRADPVPISSPSAWGALIRRIMTSNSVISPDSLNSMRSTCPLSCHLPILAENSGAASLEPAIRLPSVYSPPARLWKRCQFGRVDDEG